MLKRLAEHGLINGESDGVLATHPVGWPSLVDKIRRLSSGGFGG